MHLILILLILLFPTISYSITDDQLALILKNKQLVSEEYDTNDSVSWPVDGAAQETKACLEVLRLSSEQNITSSCTYANGVFYININDINGRFKYWLRPIYFSANNISDAIANKELTNQYKAFVLSYNNNPKNRVVIEYTALKFCVFKTEFSKTFTMGQYHTCMLDNLYVSRNRYSLK